jgi:hypothetical protein
MLGKHYLTSQNVYFLNISDRQQYYSPQRIVALLLMLETKSSSERICPIFRGFTIVNMKSKMYNATFWVN